MENREVIEILRDMGGCCSSDNEYIACDMAISALEKQEGKKPIAVETNIYDQEEIHHGCTVQILRNSVTGDVSVGWWKEKGGGRMKEYIEREEALMIAKILVHTAYTRTEKIKDTEIEKAINDIPAADVRPVIRGEWIKQEPYNQNYWKCSNCGETNKYAYRDGDVTIYELQDFFCPNCGARMDGGVDK